MNIVENLKNAAGKLALVIGLAIAIVAVSFFQPTAHAQFIGPSGFSYQIPSGAMAVPLVIAGGATSNSVAVFRPGTRGEMITTIMVGTNNANSTNAIVMYLQASFDKAGTNFTRVNLATNTITATTTNVVTNQWVVSTSLIDNCAGVSLNITNGNVSQVVISNLTIGTY